MLQKASILENIFENRFSMENLLVFAREFFDSIKVTAPGQVCENVPVEYQLMIESYHNTAVYKDPDGSTVDILAVKLRKGSMEQSRSIQRSVISKILSGNQHDAAIVAFYSDEEERWKLSFVRPDYEFATGNVKMEPAPTKRFSYLVGKREPCYTAMKQLLPIFMEEKFHPTLDRIEEAFSVENVTKDFFGAYKEKYLELKEYLDKDKYFIIEANAHQFTGDQFAKKLMGQIAFLYFLQKKGWLGMPDISGKFNLSHREEGSRTLIRDWFDVCIKEGKNYYKDFLVPVFGGLFKPLLDYDRENVDFKIPDSLFSNEEEKGRYGADGILDIFDRYNFTVNEDEPQEREVAVDPEMLGKVFENLLDVKDRRSKGTFYTPREIVHTMCRESILHYLVSKIRVPYADMKQFVLYGEFMKDVDCNLKPIRGGKKRLLPDSVYRKSEQIDHALADIRVADPAAGSGAFLLGMISEIVKIRDNITYYIEALEQREDKRSIQEERSMFRLKWNTMKNCIYAMDIEASAVDIAKLRLWLSLAVDADPGDAMEDVAYGYRKRPPALPDLDCNIMCGDSLLNGFEDIRFKEKGGFDIVIGNPPYGAEFSPETKKLLSRKYSYSIKGKFESYRIFMELSERIGNDNAVLSYVVPNTWMSVEQAIGLRKYWLEHFTFYNIIQYPQKVFRATVDTVSYVAQKNGLRQDTSIIIIPLSESVHHIAKYTKSAQTINQEVWMEHPKYLMMFGTDLDEMKFMDRLFSGNRILGDVIFTRQGLIPYLTKEEGKQNRYISTVKKDASWKEYLDGSRCVGRYGLKVKSSYIQYGNWLYAPREKEIFSQPRIIFQLIRNISLKKRIIASYLEEEIYSDRNTGLILAKNGSVSLKYILGLMNSTLYNFIHSKTHNSTYISFPSIEALPYKEADKETVSRIEALVDIILMKKKADFNADTSAEEETIDSIIYNLFGLAEEEKAMIKGSVTK